MEYVLSVPTALLQPYLTKRGLISENTDKILNIIKSSHVFLPRPEAENDPGHRQIISYVTLVRGDEVFSTRRLKGGNESRLHGLISLGIGGHINPDEDSEDILMGGLEREIHEEVFIENIDISTLRFLGFINDDSNDVGKVHLGLCCTLDVQGEVSVRETEKLMGQWLKKDELPALADSMETWSSLIIDNL